MLIKEFMFAFACGEIKFKNCPLVLSFSRKKNITFSFLIVDVYCTFLYVYFVFKVAVDNLQFDTSVRCMNECLRSFSIFN